MTRLLNTYQLWLDDLFPKAKFADGLTMIEKVGHTKSKQMRRKGWIDEGRPKPADDSDREMSEGLAKDGSDENVHNQAGTNGASAERSMLVERPSHISGLESAPLDVAPDEDELDALLAESANPAGAQTASSTTVSAGRQQQPSNRDTFSEEEEAMAGMEW